MVIGWKSDTQHRLPPGRKAFPDSTHTIVSGSRTDIVRPGAHDDGQPIDGTPQGAEHRSTGAGYLDKSAKAYRRELGERPGVPNNTSKKSPYEDGSPSASGPNNPAARSKGMAYHGKPHEPGYADLYKDPIAPSWAPRTHHTQRATEHVERVGWVAGKRVEATHPNTGRHGLDGVHDPHSSTDGVQGQAWSASGGEHGKQSPRRGAFAPRGTRTQDAGALDRGSYVPARKTK